MTDIDLIYDAAHMAEHREQRRYEIARDCMAALISTGSEESGWWTPSLAAMEAVEHADALLAALDRMK